jgi:hypothetical protein
MVALLDASGSFTSLVGWGDTNPKSFGSSASTPISDPMIIRETPPQGGTSYYLYVIATSNQNSTSQLWKIQGDDGELDSDGGDWPFGPGDAGASTEGWSITGGLNWQGSVFWATGRGDGVLYRIAHSPVSTKYYETGAPDILNPPHIQTDASAANLYFAPDDRFIWKLDADTMVAPVSSAWTSNKSASLTNTNTTSPYARIGGGHNAGVYAGCGTNVWMLTGTDGTSIWQKQVTGGPSTGMIQRGAWLYFGTDNGWLYKMSATNGGVPSGWPWGIPGSPKVVGCSIDNKTGAVFFVTDDGRM